MSKRAAPSSPTAKKRPLEERLSSPRKPPSRVSNKSPSKTSRRLNPSVEPRLRHVVVFSFLDSATAEQKEALVAGAQGMPEKIPEILKINCGLDLGLSDGNAGFSQCALPPGPHSATMPQRQRRSLSGERGSPRANTARTSGGKHLLFVCHRRPDPIALLPVPRRRLRLRRGLQGVREAPGAPGADQPADQADHPARDAHRRPVLDRPVKPVTEGGL